jgi:pimeloyl-ACP methyl ester carboxylesterase
VPAYAHAWKKAIAQAELVSVPEAGHMITLEKTEHVAKAIAKLG